MERVEGPVYVDTSALVKLYLPEPGSAALNRTLSGRRDLVVSDLALTEIVSALARRLREQELADEPARRLYRRLLDDRASGVYLPVALSSRAHREAERLLLSSGDVPLRAADALHLSLALAAEARTLATFDARMRAAAEASGLSALPRAGPSG